MYTFYNNYGFAFVIINKDQNPSLVGTVDVFLDYLGKLECIYMEAPTLASTSGITIGNISFVSNNSNFVGSYSTVDFYPTNGVFKISIKYAQAAYCKLGQEEVYNHFNRKKTGKY